MLCFSVTPLVAMAVTTIAGLVAQRWMSFELVSVDDSVGSWAMAAGILAVIALVTAAVIGWPCAAIARRLLVSRGGRVIASCLLAATAATVAFHFVVPFSQTAVDRVLVSGLCLLFFAVLYAVRQRGTEEAGDGRISERC